jgi:DNA alkylation repair enzyme
MPKDAIAALLKTTRSRLKAAAEPKFETALRWFFKEPVDPYGVRSPQIQEIARQIYREWKHWPLADRDRFIIELWKSGKLEEGVLATHVYRRLAKSCGEREFRMFEQWLNRYVRNWSHCDGLSAWLLAASIANHPGLADRLPPWTKSLEAALGGGVAHPGSQARPPDRNNFPHLRFVAERFRRHGAERRRMAAQGNIPQAPA